VFDWSPKPRSSGGRINRDRPASTDSHGNAEVLALPVPLVDLAGRHSLAPTMPSSRPPAAAEKQGALQEAMDWLRAMPADRSQAATDV
jgi:hypothetical protein